MNIVISRKKTINAVVEDKKVIIDKYDLPEYVSKKDNSAKYTKTTFMAQCAGHTFNVVFDEYNNTNNSEVNKDTMSFTTEPVLEKATFKDVVDEDVKATIIFKSYFDGKKLEKLDFNCCMSEIFEFYDDME